MSRKEQEIVQQALQRSKEILEGQKKATKRASTLPKADAPPPKLKKLTEFRPRAPQRSSVKKSVARKKSPLDPQPDNLPKLVLNPRNRRFPPQPTATAPPEGTVRTEFTPEQKRKFRKEADEQRKLQEEWNRQQPLWQPHSQCQPISQPQHPKPAESYTFNYWDNQYELQQQQQKNQHSYYTDDPQYYQHTQSANKQVFFGDTEYAMPQEIKIEPEDTVGYDQTLYDDPSSQQFMPQGQVKDEEGADIEVGPQLNSDNCFPREYESLRAKRRKKQSQIGTPALEVFAKMMSETPWEGDEEIIDETLIAAPKANLTKPKAGHRQPRTCWIRLRRKWLKNNFMTHLIAKGNMRYRGVTYSSICHHPSTPWDAHPLCWQCYHDLQLPLCGLTPSIACEFCNMMGPNATKCRVDKLRNGKNEKRKYASKTAIPHNCYTQADVDAWMSAKNYEQAPNPDWLVEGSPVGNCFPEKLVRPGDSIADSITDHPEWKRPGFLSEIEAHNKTKRIQYIPATVPSANNAYVPACLDWGKEAPVEKEEEVTAQKIDSWTNSMQDKFASYVDSSMKTMQMLVSFLVGSDALKTKPTKVSDREWQNLLGTLDQEQFQDVFEQAGGQVGELSIEKLAKMPPDQLRELIESQQMQTQQQLTTNADNIDNIIVQNLDLNPQQQELQASNIAKEIQNMGSDLDLSGSPHASRLSRSSSVETKRKGMKSPLLLEQRRLPELQELYREQGVEFKDWSAKAMTPLHGAPYVEAPDSQFNDLLISFRELNLGVSWVKNSGHDQHKRIQEVAMPMIEPEFLVKFWNLMAELRGKEPFDVRFELPEEIGILHGLSPHFSLRSTRTVPDVSGKYPTNTDRLLVGFAELEQLIKFGNAAISLNNVMFVASKVLTWRIEDVGTPLSQDRRTERILCAVIRESTKLLNDILLKKNIIESCILRRDSMLRASYNPRSHPVTFCTPVPSTGPFILNFDTSQLMKWIDDWGNQMSKQQREDKVRWEVVKAKRDAVFARQKEMDQEVRFQRYQLNPSKPPSEARSPVRFDSVQLAEDDVNKARQRHISV